MRPVSALWRAALVGGAVLAVCSSAGAQVPPLAPPAQVPPLAPAAQVPPLAPPPNLPAEVNACLCLHQAAGALAAEKDAKAQALAAVNRQLTDLDTQLASERPRVDTSNPDSVSRYKALLERRDAAFGQISPAQADAARAVARYNASVEEYNQRCTRLPIDPGLAAAMQGRLVCPPLQ
jgi:hypothetical protein